MKTRFAGLFLIFLIAASLVGCSFRPQTSERGRFQPIPIAPQSEGTIQILDTQTGVVYTRSATPPPGGDATAFWRSEDPRTGKTVVTVLNYKFQ